MPSTIFKCIQCLIVRCLAFYFTTCVFLAILNRLKMYSFIPMNFKPLKIDTSSSKYIKLILTSYHLSHMLQKYDNFCFRVAAILILGKNGGSSIFLNWIHQKYGRVVSCGLVHQF